MNNTLFLAMRDWSFTRLITIGLLCTLFGVTVFVVMAWLEQQGTESGEVPHRELTMDEKNAILQQLSDSNASITAREQIETAASMTSHNDVSESAKMQIINSLNAN